MRCEICHPPKLEKLKTIAEYDQMCACGHKHGRHWYYVMGKTESRECRDCDCRRVHTHSKEGPEK